MFNQLMEDVDNGVYSKDELLKALNVLQRIAQGDDWFPIESAPHGIWIMIHAYGNWHQACWNANGWWDTYRDNRIMLQVPEYWKPLDGVKHIEMLMKQEEK